MPDLDWLTIAINTAYTTVVGMLVVGVIMTAKRYSLRILQWFGMKKKISSHNRTEQGDDAIHNVPVTVHSTRASYDAAPNDDGVLHVLVQGDKGRTGDG